MRQEQVIIMSIKKILFFAIVLIFLFASCKKESSSNYGLVFSQEEYDKVPQKARLVTREYNSLPSKVDLRKFTPSVGDQGDYGMCVAWSTTYCAMSFADAYQKQTYSFDIFSPYYLYRKCNPYDRHARRGMCVETALDFLKEKGVPYRNSDENFVEFPEFEVSVYNDSKKYKIENYSTLFNKTSSSDFRVLSVKKSLSENKPVVFSMLVPSSFYSCKDVFYGEDLAPSNSGHAMCLVGYDDSKYGGSFLIQNSWGKDWGNNGYTWIPYSVFSDKKYVMGAYEINNAVFEKVDAPQEHINLPEYNLHEDEIKKQMIYKGSFYLPLAYKNENIEVVYDGNSYVSKKSYSSLDRFQFYMTNEKPCYVYAFSSDDATGCAVKIFPENNVSAYLSYSKNTICYPGENTYIEFDEISGTDYLIVLYSQKELQIDEIMKKYEKSVKQGMTGENNFYERVLHACGKENLIDKNLVNYSLNKISFEGFSTRGDLSKVLPILIKLKHDKN